MPLQCLTYCLSAPQRLSTVQKSQIVQKYLVQSQEGVYKTGGSKNEVIKDADESIERVNEMDEIFMA